MILKNIAVLFPNIGYLAKGSIIIEKSASFSKKEIIVEPWLM